MNPEAVRKVLRTRFLWFAVAACAVTVAGAVAAPALDNIVWAVVVVAFMVAMPVQMYRSEVARLRWAEEDRAHEEERRQRQYERDVELERLAQEADIVAADGPGADEIRARWAVENQERQARYREERQSRIAAYEANRLDV